MTLIELPKKSLELVKDVGLTAGIGSFLILCSWIFFFMDEGIPKIDITTTKSLFQLVGLVFSVVGLTLILQRATKAKERSDKVTATAEADDTAWANLIARLKNKGCLTDIGAFEYMDRLSASIKDLRTELGSKIDSSQEKSRVRGLLERLQHACREFDSTMQEIDRQIKQRIRLRAPDYLEHYPQAADTGWNFPHGIQSSSNIYPPVFEWVMIVAIGVLRGRFAEALEGYEGSNNLSKGDTAGICSTGSRLGHVFYDSEVGY